MTNAWRQSASLRTTQARWFAVRPSSHFDSPLTPSTMPHLDRAHDRRAIVFLSPTAQGISPRSVEGKAEEKSQPVLEILELDGVTRGNEVRPHVLSEPLTGEHDDPFDR